MKEISTLQNLLNKVEATAKTRFYAARRFKAHAKLSTYAVVIISMGLILIALLQAYNIGININSPYVNLIQAFSSIAILVYSLIIDKNEYSMLSDKMYSCASKLTELKQKMYPCIDNSESEAYEGFANEYHRVLRLYETHSINYFKYDYMHAKLEMRNVYELSFSNRVWHKIKIAYGYTMNFFSYVIVVAVLGWVLCWIWWGAGLPVDVISKNELIPITNNKQKDAVVEETKIYSLVLKDKVRIRNIPSTTSNSRVINKMPLGSTVEIITKQGEWRYVRYEGTVGEYAIEGWVYSGMLRLTNT